MSDDLEPRVHDAFHQGSLPAAPAQLVDGLEAITAGPVRRRRRRDRRTPLALLVAAVALVGIGVVAVGGGALRPAPSAALEATSPPSAPAASVPADDLRISLTVRSVEGIAPTAAEMATIVSILEARVAALGAAGPTVSISGTDTIMVDLPGLTDGATIAHLLGDPGRVDFVPLGSTEGVVGQTLDLATYPPLFSNDGVATASVGADQNQRPAIDVVLTPAAAQAFATYTATHVGSYFAITLDGVVLTAPAINDAITDGRVQISGGGPDGFSGQEAASIVTILRSGVLPQVDITDWSVGTRG